MKSPFHYDAQSHSQLSIRVTIRSQMSQMDRLEIQMERMKIQMAKLKSRLDRTMIPMTWSASDWELGPIADEPLDSDIDVDPLAPIRRENITPPATCRPMATLPYRRSATSCHSPHPRCYLLSANAELRFSACFAWRPYIWCASPSHRYF